MQGEEAVQCGMRAPRLCCRREGVRSPEEEGEQPVHRGVGRVGRGQDRGESAAHELPHLARLRGQVVCCAERPAHTARPGLPACAHDSADAASSPQGSNKVRGSPPRAPPRPPASGRRSISPRLLCAGLVGPHHRHESHPRGLRQRQNDAQQQLVALRPDGARAVQRGEPGGGRRDPHLPARALPRRDSQQQGRARLPHHVSGLRGGRGRLHAQSRRLPLSLDVGHHHHRRRR